MNTSEEKINFAKERLWHQTDATGVGVYGHALDLEACYQAMLDVQDYKWRLDHQQDLALARNSLANLLGLEPQIVQEHYEDIAMKKINENKKVCF